MAVPGYTLILTNGDVLIPYPVGEEGAGLTQEGSQGQVEAGEVDTDAEPDKPAAGEAFMLIIGTKGQ